MLSGSCSTTVSITTGKNQEYNHETIRGKMYTDCKSDRVRDHIYFQVKSLKIIFPLSEIGRGQQYTMPSWAKNFPSQGQGPISATTLTYIILSSLPCIKTLIDMLQEQRKQNLFKLLKYNLYHISA